MLHLTLPDRPLIFLSISRRMGIKSVTGVQKMKRKPGQLYIVGLSTEFSSSPTSGLIPRTRNLLFSTCQHRFPLSQ